MADRYLVIGQVFIANGTGVITEVGRHVASATLNVTTQGNFTFSNANGTTATVASGTATVTGSPVTLSAGSNTITVTGTGTITLTVTIGTAANWNSVNSWSASTGGACGASVPASTSDCFFNANSFTAASQVLTVDASASVKSMTWTGATNNPTLTLGGYNISLYGSLVFIAAMTLNATGNNYISCRSNSTVNITSSSLVWGCGLYSNADFTGTITLQDAFASSVTGTSLNAISIPAGILITNSQTVTLTGIFSCTGTVARTVNISGSTVTCSTWTATTTTNLTFTTDANSKIIQTGNNTFNGGGLTYNNVELQGLTPTMAGANTFTLLTMTGQADTGNNIKFTASITQVITTLTLVGYSADYWLKISSTSSGAAATLTVTNWTGTQYVGFKDITSTNAANLSGITGTCVNFGGNTNITFKTNMTQRDIFLALGGA